jgi:fermentation-respiration switch protein FrsA (DUF1100 family)
MQVNILVIVAMMLCSKVEPIAHAARCETPALYAHGKDDSFVNPHHTQMLHDRHASEHKELIFVDGNHNSCRPSTFLDATSRFIYQHILTQEEQGMTGRRWLRLCRCWY